MNGLFMLHFPDRSEYALTFICQRLPGWHLLLRMEMILLNPAHVEQRINNFVEIVYMTWNAKKPLVCLLEHKNMKNI